FRQDFVQTHDNCSFFRLRILRQRLLSQVPGIANLTTFQMNGYTRASDMYRNYLRLKGDRVAFIQRMMLQGSNANTVFVHFPLWEERRKRRQREQQDIHVARLQEKFEAPVYEMKFTFASMDENSQKKITRSHSVNSLDVLSLMQDLNLQQKWASIWMERVYGCVFEPTMHCAASLRKTSLIERPALKWPPIRYQLSKGGEQIPLEKTNQLCR
uniref:Uncharacterized protein n=1 Tax=Strigamia maritima TaxID=126957 RepID=T1IQQ1_STRMM